MSINARGPLPNNTECHKTQLEMMESFTEKYGSHFKRMVDVPADKYVGAFNVYRLNQTVSGSGVDLTCAEDLKEGTSTMGIQYSKW